MSILTKREIEAEYRFAKTMTVIEPPGDCDDHIRDLAETCVAMRKALEEWVKWDNISVSSLTWREVHAAYTRVITLTKAAGIDWPEQVQP